MNHVTVYAQLKFASKRISPDRASTNQQHRAFPCSRKRARQQIQVGAPFPALLRRVERARRRAAPRGRAEPESRRPAEEAQRARRRRRREAEARPAHGPRHRATRSPGPEQAPATAHRQQGPRRAVQRDRQPGRAPGGRALAVQDAGTVQESRAARAGELCWEDFFFRQSSIVMVLLSFISK